LLESAIHDVDNNNIPAAKDKLKKVKTLFQQVPRELVPLECSAINIKL